MQVCKLLCAGCNLSACGKLIIALAGIVILCSPNGASSKAPKSSTETPRSVVRCPATRLAVCLWPLAQPALRGPMGSACGAQLDAEATTRAEVAL